MSPMNPRLLRPTASGGFDPRKISGLALWLDAADSATLYNATTSGSLVAADGAVGRWEDKSGNARHATQGHANNRPLRKAAVQNSRDGILFDGSDDSLATALFEQTVACTLFIVHRPTSMTQQNFGRVVERGANNGIAIVNLGTNPATNYAIQYAITQASDSGIALNTSTRLLEYRATSDATRQIALSVDGGAAFTMTRTETPTTPNAFFLSRFGGNESNYGGQTIFEICYYDRLLSDSDRDTIREYLRTKWNVY